MIFNQLPMTIKRLFYILGLTVFGSLLSFGNFFYVHAQTRNTDRPDFKITTATFDGQNLHVEYINTTGIYDRRRYEVGFQWYDTKGNPVGIRHWFPVPQVDRGGVSIFDTKYPIELSYRRGKSIYGKQLTDFIKVRPNDAAVLRFTVDDGDRIPETDEQNNVAVLTLPPLPTPDFTITGATALTADTLTVAVKNIGAVPGQDSLSYWFEWVNYAGGRVGPLYWYDTRGNIAPAQEIRLDVARALLRRERPRDALSDPANFADLMTSAPTSATHLKIRVDGPNTYPETDEGNNVLLLPKPIPPQADLAMSDLKVGSGNVITFTIQNNGDAATGGDVSIWFHGATTGGVQVGPLYWYDTPEIPAGQTRALSSKDITVRSETGDALLSAIFTNYSPEANHFKILLDGPDKIAEKNEGNNMALLLRPVPPKADLTFSQITVIPEAPNPHIAYAVSNTGAADANDVTLELQWLAANGNPTGSAHSLVTAGLLRPNDTSKTQLLIQDSGPTPGQTGRFLVTPPADATKIRFTLDPQNVITESDETNNATVVERPNILLSDLAITDASLTRGGLTFTYRNIGPVRGGLQPTMSLWFEWVDARGVRVGDEFAWLDVKALPVKSFEKIESGILRVYHKTRGEIPFDDFLTTAPDNATQFKIQVDGPNTILESDETNNVARLPKPEAKKLPDLALTAVTRADGLVKVTISNGTPDIIRTPLLQFKWLDAQSATLATSPVSFWSGANIASGATGDFAIDYANWREDGVTRFLKNPPAGSTALLALIDPENKLKESNEDNNTARIVLGQADLIVDAFTVANNELYLQIKNTGTVASEATDVWLMWFAGSRALSSSAAIDLPTVKPGGFGFVRIPFDGKTEAANILREPPKDGTKLRIYLDGSRKVEEVDENNNDMLLDRAKLFPVMPENKPPVADAGEDATERDDDGDGIEIVRFYSRESKDTDGKVVAWSWTFKGKEIATGQYPYWRNAPVGVNEVMLTVTDDKGATATDTVIITVAPKPSSFSDLRVAEFKLEPAAPKVGDIVEFMVRVENSGAVSAGQVSTTTLDIDLKNDGTLDEPKGQFVTKDLKPGESETHRWRKDYGRDYTWTAIAGKHAFTACANRGGYIKDADSKNNCQRLVLTVGAPLDTKPKLPDLAIREPQLLEQSSYRYYIQTFNLGEAIAPPHTWDLQWVDKNDKDVGPPYRSAFDQDLLPGQSVANPMQYKRGNSQIVFDKYMFTPPAGAVRVRATVDPENKLAESDETNNSRFIPPPPELENIVPPELTLSLSVEIIPISTAAAASSVATLGLLIAFSAFMGGTIKTYHHSSPRKNFKGFFSLFPLLFTSAHNSYMRLRGCGPEECAGEHFARHKKFKRLTHISLAAIVLAGATKLAIVLALGLFTASAQPLLAKEYTASPGDQIRARLTVKNTGQITANNIVMSLPCPQNSTWKNSTLDEKNLPQNSTNAILVSPLPPTDTHNLTAVCLIEKSATGIGKLNIMGSARAKNMIMPVTSNSVIVQIVTPPVTPPPENKPIIPSGLPDLTVDRADLLAITDLKKDKAAFEATGIGIIVNNGKTTISGSDARLRIDIGNDGSWDLLSPPLALDAILAGERDIASWTFQWNAPVGAYLVEACVDVNNKITEANELNNCARLNVTLITGDEPVVTADD